MQNRNEKSRSDYQAKIVESLIEVTLPSEDSFLKIKETLTRIGVASKKSNTLYQSCHILHKKGRYYIVTFKELFALDGKPTEITEDDLRRRNSIALLLDEWGLCKVIDPRLADTEIDMAGIKILPFSEKKDWELVCKYNIGKVRR
jgi:hypothetical protein